mgnify:CR=1 FL=1
MTTELHWGDSLSSIIKAIYIRRVNGVSDKIHVGIVTLITDDGITTYDYELEYVTIMSYVPSLIDKMKSEHNIQRVCVAKDTRKLFSKYLRKEENNA